jgi:DNA invertase Pin-like site-specific DNA recombinase
MAIDPRFEFADEAVSGTKLKRAGLDAVAAAKRGEYQVLFFQSLSRLARESLISMTVLKDLVFNHNVRVVCFGEYLDTSYPGWEMVANNLSMLHELFLKHLSQNIRRGHEHAMRLGYALPDGPFGYAVEHAPGTERGKGRGQKCRTIYVIKEPDAGWVRQIFHWFTVDRWSITRIAQELTRRGAPKDHRATTKKWRPDYVRRLLSNPRYIGQWPWGVLRNMRNPLDGTVTAEVRPESEWGRNTRDKPELRIIDDATWAAAQARLPKCRELAKLARQEEGKFKGTNFRNTAEFPRHLLAGLLKCSACGNTFTVASAGRMICAGVRTGACDRSTQLNRRNAERMTLHHVLTRVFGDSVWRAAVLGELQTAWRELMRQHPNRRKAVAAELAEVEMMIESLLGRLETKSGSSDLLLVELLQLARGDRLAGNEIRLQRPPARPARAAAAAEGRTPRGVEGTGRPREGTIPEPTAEWVGGQLDALRDRLTGSGPSACPVLRELIGGSIEMTHVDPGASGRAFWRGRLVILPAAVTRAIAGRYSVNLPEADGAATPAPYEVTLDFINRRGNVFMDRVTELRDRGYTIEQIKQELGIGYRRVKSAMEAWYRRDGATPPVKPPAHQRPPYITCAKLAEQVIPLYDRGLTVQEISEIVDRDRNTVRKAINYWFQADGVKQVDGRARYQQLLREQRTQGGAGAPTA